MDPATAGAAPGRDAPVSRLRLPSVVGVVPASRALIPHLGMEALVPGAPVLSGAVLCICPGLVKQCKAVGLQAMGVQDLVAWLGTHVALGVGPQCRTSEPP